MLICKRFVMIPTEFIWISPKNLLLISNKNININLTRTAIDYSFNKGILCLVIHVSVREIMAKIVMDHDSQQLIAEQRYFNELNISKINEKIGFTDLIRYHV